MNSFNFLHRSDIEQMNHIEQFETIIVGMGETGFSCARYLSARQVHFAIADSRDEPPRLDEFKQAYPGVTIFTGKFDPGVLSCCKEILLSPGVSINDPAIQQAIRSGVEVYGDVELFCRNVTAPVIAITGSNGKSTVTTLVAEILKAAGKQIAVGANLGTPALDLLPEKNIDCYVLELSSFQLETCTSLNALAAVVLNISDDHMDRYPDLITYAISKARIFQGDGTMVINIDDPNIRDMKLPGRTIRTFSLDESARTDYNIKIIDDVKWLCRSDNKIIDCNRISLRGDHNLANVMAAIALVDEIGVPDKIICSTLESFSGLPHRCQFVAEINGVKWINDSKGTNVGATIAAIRGLANGKNIVLIAGGDGKGADFSPLQSIADHYLSTAILIGRDAPLIRKVLEDHVNLVDTLDMKVAVEVAAKVSKPGDIVLMSPACASLDMFQDYRERGDVFSNAVKQLGVSHG